MNQSDSNRVQAEQWGGETGDHWVNSAEHHDRMLAPFAEQLALATNLLAGESVLDVGCGNGFTTIEAARLIGATGSALGVDLSPQMLGVARARAEIAGVAEWSVFELADAQTADLNGTGRDLAMSRFGVMFFDDPVAAFANIATALRPGGRLGFCCWQPVEANHWVLLPGTAAAEYVAIPPRPPDDEPGMFSLGRPDRIKSILGDAGFTDIEIDSFETSALLAGGGSLDETMKYLLSSGFGRPIREAPEPNRTEAIEAVRVALEPAHDGDGVRLPAAAWIVTARR